MGLKPGPKPIAKSTGKPDQRRRDNKDTPGNTPGLKPSKIYWEINIWEDDKLYVLLFHMVNSACCLPLTHYLNLHCSLETEEN